MEWETYQVDVQVVCDKLVCAVQVSSVKVHGMNYKFDEWKQASERLSSISQVPGNCLLVQFVATSKDY